VWIFIRFGRAGLRKSLVDPGDAGNLVIIPWKRWEHNGAGQHAPLIFSLR